MEHPEKEIKISGNCPTSSVGIILVLFILLVIILSVFIQPSAATDDPQPGALSTVTFTIKNNSSYAFELVSQTRSGCVTAAPSIINANGGSASIGVKKSFPNIYHCETYWAILDQTGNAVSEITIRLETNGKLFGSNTFDIVNFDTPLRFSINGTTVTFTNS
ncbi:hypothetical protein [Paenibacillus herberti]|uniref:Uncharacterized protein n=1 Tax=Paenibacillus herberti TaxID=1619309 RepID=A0A229P409_9BACL|nr:hypothetical protein [Paenibacillus herberti]OXM16807.1 hypothetical protein CGZ75_09185 [Paenibacillus herberti]